ncbi:2-dehydro-3-deoxy-D-gluconate 5-dehydrogenase [Candida viswanathii]|uniref:2-dehydro-3-deoxy-D-gluconate 5-dehydrogenase n=1 Tax=Candida viswanathii TaxID=5486 RepID=A0A367YG57_9ASCO|nr:2-dehydro-3-deoxy-D-gluconate 5-dehydrogenase [Candida viswanathii]
MSQLFSLKGQVAILTGGTNGIGLGYAKGLASAELDQLILTYRSVSTFEKAKAVILDVNPNVQIDGVQVDFVKEDEDDIVSKIVGEAYRVSKTGKVDILVNNAGITERYLFEEFPQEKFNDIIKVDLNIPVKLTKAVGTRMLESNTKGKIVFTASLMSFQGGMSCTPYAISKGAIKQFTQAVSNEWSSRGIRVNSIAPGYIATNMTDTMNDEAKQLVDKRIPMKRWGNPDDFMGPIVFLTSDASKYVTGETLLVDGGWMAR